MSSNQVKECFDFIKEVIREAGQIVFEGFHRNDKNVEEKENKRFDLVTIFDRKVEHFFTIKIKERYPNHEIIGEETWPSGETLKLTDSHTWIIDPIDGTINFIKNIPLIGISVALAIEKEVVLGIVYNPITNEFFSAIKGEGSYYNEQRIHSTTNTNLHKAIISNELSLASIPFLHERTLERVKKITQLGVLGFRSLGSAAITLCYVANGSIDIYFTDGLKCWDIAAGILILQEAGGFASSPDGRPYDMFSRVLLAAGNNILLENMVKILTECDNKTFNKVDELMPPELKLSLQQ